MMEKYSVSDVKDLQSVELNDVKGKLQELERGLEKKASPEKQQELEQLRSRKSHLEEALKNQ